MMKTTMLIFYWNRNPGLAIPLIALTRVARKSREQHSSGSSGAEKSLARPGISFSKSMPTASVVPRLLQRGTARGYSLRKRRKAICAVLNGIGNFARGQRTHFGYSHKPLDESLSRLEIDNSHTYLLRALW